MTEAHFYHSRADQHRIGVHHWPARLDQVNGVAVWLHGMAEHGARYAPLAEALNRAGWHLYCPDHRGHGTSIDDACPQGHLGDQDGWNHTVDDACAILTLAAERHPGLPLVLGGHSMGSFIALAAAERTTLPLDGLVLCGSDYHPGFYYTLMRLPLLFERRRHGKRGTSALIRKLTFESWASQIDGASTDFDWLSNDSAQVQAYIDDPLCGFDCTTETWVALVTGLKDIHSINGLASLPDDLPVLLLGGEADPMSANGRGMMALEKVLHAMEQPVTAHFWDQGRHEILNDTCRDEVLAAITEWLGGEIGRGRRQA
ncbi:alpha/beta hydrolase [Alcanivorax hongdengensis A-11-3]|uniref:Alpha/beta hydrolase n=1 Tax=Alcanivorax hongdengensis A-11-3 TaxID=1177179 RepID=L0WA97_9GAMM|nr:alpha/beta hydrolase [Alcanivorax hongdengensis]EKF73007.1 alpha/beta hydrolase [Alcanivorax hongdengensis A-11-3]